MANYSTYTIGADTNLMEASADDLGADIDAVNGIEAVPTILEVICRTTGMGFAAIARVTEDRWVACAVRDEIQFGLRSGSELPILSTISNKIRQNRRAVVINNIADDETYRAHPSPAMYGFQSYIAMPITLSDGTFFGTLCAVDPQPARLNTPETIRVFGLFSEMIALHLSVVERAVSGEANLLAERKTGELREQFIAVLGHDLRNPLSAISACIGTLRRMPLDESARRTVRLIQESTSRISGLVDDIMDLSRGHLCGGLTLNRDGHSSVQTILRQVIAELQSVWPNAIIEAHFAITEPVHCDHRRIGQLLSNLLGNALTYGLPNMPVRVRSATDGEIFELSVSNSGDPVPPATLERLFQPFFRGGLQPKQEGLGLGLFIASEIARAHGGTLDAISTFEETRFTFRMPRA